MAVYTIELKDVKFFAFHGVHEEERRTGNEFLVNLSAELSPGIDKITSIKETVNYVSLFEIVKKEMMQPVDLLETLINNIIDRVHNAFPEIKRITVTVDKLNPLISSFSGKVSVTCEKKF